MGRQDFRVVGWQLQFGSFDQELFYLNTEDYNKHARQQIEEAKRLVQDLGLAKK